MAATCDLYDVPMVNVEIHMAAMIVPAHQDRSITLIGMSVKVSKWLPLVF